MMAPKTISVDWLDRKRACGDQVELFLQSFGTSASLTRANLIRAAEVGLNIDWLARHTLTLTARTAYHKAKASALEAYNVAVAPAWAAFDNNNGPVAPAWAAYKAAVAPANAEYEKAKASALADILGLEDDA